MTDEQFITATRQLSEALVELVRRREFPADDAAQILGAACAEAMAVFLGHPHAVERLRDIADIAERDVLRAHAR